MDHWRLAYLGIRQVARELSEFELSTFFTFSKRERAQIDTRRTDLYRLAIALHVGFLRMTGRPLDSYRQIPTVLWRHLGQQLAVQPPDVGTLRSIYDGNFKTLSDHQGFAKIIVDFRSIAEHQRRYVIRWLKEQLSGRPERGQLMSDLKRWFYEHRIVIPPDRRLRQDIRMSELGRGPSQVLVALKARIITVGVTFIRAAYASIRCGGCRLQRGNVKDLSDNAGSPTLMFAPS